MNARRFLAGGYHPTTVGDKFKEGRYVALQKLGWGHFSVVWLVWDTAGGRVGALKIQKSAAKYSEAAQDEVEILEQLNKGAGGQQGTTMQASVESIVTLWDHFFHHGPNGKHMCMLFEVMGQSLLSLIKRYDYKGVPIPVVKRIAKDTAVGLDYMHRVCQLIHTDLKPENVLMCLTAEDEAKMHELGRRAYVAQTKRDAEKPQSQPAGGGAAAPKSKKALARARQRQRQKERQAALGAVAQPGGAAEPDEVLVDDPDDDEAGGDAAEAAPQPAPEVVPAAAAPAAVGRRMLASPGQLFELLGGAAHASQCVRPALCSVCGLAAAAAAVGTEADGCALQPEPQLGNVTEQGNSGDPLAELAVLFRPDYTKWDPAQFRVKLADMGTACWVTKHFTDDIQTREYRCPEVILGAKYGTPVDMWSMACLVFELACGDQLFDPRSGDNYEKDEDHLAQVIELLGRFPKSLSTRGKYASDFFNRKGELRHVKKLNYWPLVDILNEKYEMEDDEAKPLADFLAPMLQYHADRRVTAEVVLQHTWLQQAERTQPEV
eukprot:SAG22_NODE_95_length_20791_cov_40.318514_2_plen_547_part_00